MPNNAPDDSAPTSASSAPDAYAAIRIPSFRWYFVGSMFSILGMQMQAITVVWEIYNRTGRPLDVGLVGLVQVVPVLSLALLAGHVVDRFNRKHVLAAAVALSGLASLGLALVSWFQLPIATMYVCLALVGVARAFQQPAKSALVPQLVPKELFSRAVTWNLGGFQLASIVGPALGGWTLALLGQATIVYLLQVAGATLFVALLLLRVGNTPAGDAREATTLKSLGEGVVFVWNTKVILGAMALDMFAVLLGGATALLPFFAKDVLHVGERGYGWMASAPALGALLMSVALVHLPPMKHAGRALLVAVAGFGAAIIVFGLSTSFALSLVALTITGALDCISVVVRHTLVQMLTPDRMRGRVSAISSMFISASNELGEFESGVLASLTSPVFAVVAGGVGTLAVVATAALTVPQLRRYGRLDGLDEPLAVPSDAASVESAAEVV